jgi:hypothetical protein
MGKGRRRTLSLASGVLLALAVLAPGPAPAGSGNIEPGFDLFETDPQTTAFRFQAPDTGIPAGFFGPGSDPFQGDVVFGGVPLNSFNGQDTGDADTVVQRLGPATPTSPSVPIELVQLSLVSMEPITVTYDNGQRSELWDVSAAPSPSRPSQGEMNVEGSDQPSGTFQSVLQVVPLLTFTRLSDGQQRQFDAAALPPQSLQRITFFAENVPWRRGCVEPALPVPGLNNDFCPGLTGAGLKQLTIEQAALARHGVYPVQPALEHFRCYRVERRPFRSRNVGVADQFGQRGLRVPERRELCNPVRKNQEPFRNRKAHLQCYLTRSPVVGALVAVRNQFGSQRLRVLRSERLCLPSRKRLVRRNPVPFPQFRYGLDHYHCYRVRAETALLSVGPVRGVRLRDQFLTERVEIGPPVRLCAPARKNRTLSQHPVRHLVCYKAPGRDIRRRFEIRNQFEQRRLLALRGILLCVPSNKFRIQ